MSKTPTEQARITQWPEMSTRHRSGASTTRPSAGEPPGPDAVASLAQYQSRASRYDLELIPFEPIRRLAVAQLQLVVGQTVVDVGCGTGLSLPLLAAGVGPTGQVIGVEPSAQMLSQASSKLASCGAQVRLLLARADAVDECRMPIADAMLLHFTHDVLRNPAAVRALMRHVRPGGRVVSAGLQWAPFWAPMANLFVWSAALYSTTCLEGLCAPWDLLGSYLDDLEVEPLWAGAIYIASGRRNDRPA